MLRRCAPLPRPPLGLLFDMDGTLTEPMLNFDAIKSEMRIGDAAILESMATMDADRRAACDAILSRHETHAAEQSSLNLGCRALLDWLTENRLPTAVITRNSRQSLQTVLTKHSLLFDVQFSREDGLPKPDPQALLAACRQLNLSPLQVWMVGDGRYDVEAGNAAGVATVWLSGGQKRPFEAEPSHTVADLKELRFLLQACLTE